MFVIKELRFAEGCYFTGHIVSGLLISFGLEVIGTDVRLDYPAWVKDIEVSHPFRGTSHSQY